MHKTLQELNNETNEKKSNELDEKYKK